MYPSAFDRHRLIQILIEQEVRNQEVRNKPIKQEVLGDEIGLAQSTISDVKNLSGVPLRRKRPEAIRKWGTTRDTLLRVVGRGLKMERDKVDAIAWLFDLTPLKESEVDSYIVSHTEGPPSAVVGRASPSTRRKLILESLRQFLKGGKTQKADVKINFYQDDESRLQALEELLKIESLRGQRCLLTKHPTTLAHSRDVLASEKFISGEYQEIHSASRRRASFIDMKRLDSFESNIAIYGERSIHSLNSLREYVSSPSQTFKLSLRLRRERVESWIKLIDHHPLYEVRLVPETPDLELEIKSTMAAVLRGAPSGFGSRKGERRWGPHYVFWYDLESVLSFLLDFEQAWDAIELAEKRGKRDAIADKNNVKRRLKQLLDETAQAKR